MNSLTTLCIHNYFISSHFTILKSEGTKIAVSTSFQHMYLAYESRPFLQKVFWRSEGKHLHVIYARVCQLHGKSLLTVIVLIKYCVALAKFMCLFILLKTLDELKYDSLLCQSIYHTCTSI